MAGWAGCERIDCFGGSQRARSLSLPAPLACRGHTFSASPRGLPPEQFHRELDPALTKDYPAVLGVAHNAGNSLDTTTLALDHGADVIEIDVISVRGQVVAGRDQPWPWLGDHLFRGPTLPQVWNRADSAKVIKLDLKQTDRKFLQQIVNFLGPRAGAGRS